MATDGGGGAEPREGCSSPLLVDKDVSPALIDSIIASTSSAVGNSFNVGEGTRPSIISCELIYGCPGAGPELGYLAPELAASSTAAAAAAAAGPPTLDPAVEKCKLPTLEDGRWPLDTPDPDIWVDPIPNGVGSFPGG